jgi:outer membrane murein-binding lipoprotein Lpp
MSDMGIFSPEATRQTPAATVERAGYINEYGSRVVVAPEVDLERNIRGTYQEIEAEVDRLTRIRNQLRLETDQGAIVGSELGAANAQLFIGLTDFVDQLNDQGASIRGEQVTVEGLIAPDAKIKVRNTRIGNFEVEGVRTFTDGQELLNEVLSQDVKLYSTAVGGSNIGINGLPAAFEALNSSIEARPEIEAAMEESSQEVKELNTQIKGLQADVDALRASIGEADTKGQQSPATPAAQMNVLEDVFQRYVNGNQFDFRLRTNRLQQTREVLAPEVEAVSEYASPEVRAARNMQATVSPAPSAPEPGGGLGDGAPGSVPRTPRGRGPTPETFSPEAVRRGISATVEETADVVVSTDSSVVSGSGDGSVRLSAAQIRDANQAEVELLLAEQFGGFSFFLQKHRSDLQVGLTADGQVVAADDPNAASVKNILDVIVDQGITAPTRVLGLLENTEWWQKTDAKMREYDVLTADMSEPQKTEYLEPVLDLLREEAQFLGFQLDNDRARDLAEQITRMGEENDAEYIRGLLTAEESFNAAEVTASSFAAARDEIVAMSKRYFTPINEADAAQFAQDIYVGTKTAEGVEQYFREMAANTFPQLQNALDAGITPEQYFAPYKYEIERMLDRPNVDLYEEFGDLIQYIPDTGTGEARPMTLGEVRKYVRGLDEWQQSSQGKDSARALAFSIGKTFGQVA